MIISTALLLGSLTTSFELLHRSPRLVANVTNQSKLRFNIMRKQYLASSFGGREEGGEEEEEEPLRILPPIPTTKDTLKVNKKNIAPFIRIELREEDLEETFSRSSGSGGQHVNKTNSRVQLTHVPTQITVTCQEQRDLHMNRKIARKKLKDQLDLLYNGDKSKISKKIDKIQKRKSKAKRRAKQKYGDKEKNNNDSDSGEESDESNDDDTDSVESDAVVNGQPIVKSSKRIQ